MTYSPGITTFTSHVNHIDGDIHSGKKETAPHHCIRGTNRITGKEDTSIQLTEGAAVHLAHDRLLLPRDLASRRPSLPHPPISHHRLAEMLVFARDRRTTPLVVEV